MQQRFTFCGVAGQRRPAGKAERLPPGQYLTDFPRAFGRAELSQSRRLWEGKALRQRTVKGLP